MATSRPGDQSQHRELEALTGDARIDVTDTQNNGNDLRQYVTMMLKKTSRPLEQQPADAELICKAAAGVFMYAKEVLARLDDSDCAVIDLQTLPKGLVALYMQRYKATFPKDEHLDAFEQHSAPMLAMLVASRDALPIEVVSKAGLGHGMAVKRSQRAQRDRHLEFVKHMCIGSIADELGKLQLSHKSFADWLTDGQKSVDFHVPESTGHEKLAQVCKHALRDLIGIELNASTAAESKRQGPVNIGSDNGIMAYALKHGVAHLLLAGKEEHARRLVLDARWLVERRGDGAGIIEDCRRFASDDSAVQLVSQAVDMSMHELQLDPRRLCGQLVGRLMGAEESFLRSQRCCGSSGSATGDSTGAAPCRGRWSRRGALLRTMAGHTWGDLGSVSADGSRVVSGWTRRAPVEHRDRKCLGPWRAPIG